MTSETESVPIVPPTPDVTELGVMTRRVMATIGISILALDQLTKQMVRMSIELYDAIEVIPGFLNLVHVRNTGAAFGFLNSVSIANKQLLMTAIALVAMTAIVAYARQVEPRETLARTGLALILGGAMGNLIDRASAGYVVDFIDVYWRTYHFWAFNVADSAITVGAGFLILDMFVVSSTDVSTST